MLKKWMKNINKIKVKNNGLSLLKFDNDLYVYICWLFMNLWSLEQLAYCHAAVVEECPDVSSMGNFVQ
jgi:hypothetical protein